MRQFVCEEKKCNGCMACKDICCTGAISVIDSVKFYNAVIDSSKCIGCNQCKKVCPNNILPTMRKPMQWYQGWSKNEAIHSRSSSGGFAAEIERQFIIDGGIVCSCVFKDGAFVFEFAEKIEDVDNYKGSKYIKSDPTGAYRKIRTLLLSDKKVLFLGLPCQVAGLKNYCNSDNLYTIDLICHGSPSPVVLQSFFKSYGMDIRSIKSISFRSKDGYGIICNEKKLSIPGVKDYYTFSFLSSIILTDNCYECKFAQIERVSDLTIGDAWGSELPIDVRKKGISIALCQTEKGLELIEKSNLELMPIELEKATRANPQLVHPTKAPKERDSFLEGIINGENIKRIIRRHYPRRYYKNLVKILFHKLGLHY